MSGVSTANSQFQTIRCAYLSQACETPTYPKQCVGSSEAVDFLFLFFQPFVMDQA